MTTGKFHENLFGEFQQGPDMSGPLAAEAELFDQLVGQRPTAEAHDQAVRTGAIRIEPSPFRQLTLDELFFISS